MVKGYWLSLELYAELAFRQIRPVIILQILLLNPLVMGK